MKSQKQMQMAIRAMRKQAGMTLMEIIAALAIIAAVVVGALALFNSAQSSNQSVTMLKDIVAVKAAAQGLYVGQGGYGASTFLNPVLVAANKVPTDMSVTGTAATTQINTSLGGVLAVNSNAAGTNLVVTISNVSPEICMQLLTNASSGWSDVFVAATATGNNPTAATVSVFGAAAKTFPVTVAQAQAACVTTPAGNKLISWNSIS